MLRQQAHSGICVWVVAGIVMIAATPAWPVGPMVPAAPQPELNPTNRTFSLLVELREGDRKLGEAAIKIAPDDTISVNKAQFASACAPLLREEIAAQLSALPAKDGFLTISALNAAGFKTGFDSATMRLNFTPAVNQRPRGSVRILRGPPAGPQAERPARFSGYLNLRAGADYISAPAEAGGFSAPRANLEAVLRWEDVVVETELSYDGGETGREPLDETALAGFTRRGTRIVHDRPDDALRLQAGDINPPVTSFQRGPDLLGVSVERSLRKLRPSENIRPTGERSFRLARPSTVKVELNGTVARQLRLEPGEYDLKDLPLQSGANDIRLIITDDLGEQRTLEFTSYFDASLLAEDIYEWGFAAGARSDFEEAGLSYHDDLIATGYYREGLTSEVTGEAHVQAGRDTAMAGAGVFTATPFGFFGLEGALSYHADFGAGGALEVNWDALNTTANGTSLRLSADLRSAAFATVGQDEPHEHYWLSLLASYARELPLGIHSSLSGRYAFASRSAEGGDAYSARLGLSRTIGYDFGVGLSLEYRSDALDTVLTEDDALSDDDELRAALRLWWRPDTGTHVDAHYETGTASARVGASRSVQRGTGSWAASIETLYDPSADDIAADARFAYEGNRAVVNLEHTASMYLSADAGSRAITDQRTSLRLGTAIAFADGHVAVGRPITNGFAIVTSHDSIASHRLMLGDHTDPTGYNDALGPALVPDLPDYTPRTLRYDVEDLPVGYDLGDREFTLKPSYKSGYALIVGSAHSVSAFGTLLDGDGEPVGLVTGTVTPVDAEAPQVMLFTNGAGRFAAQGLAPGRWLIEMATAPVQRYVLEIPPQTQGLHRAGTLTPQPTGEEPS